MNNTYNIHIGDNQLILPTLPDNSIDSIVTDPPYELGFMGKTWDATGIAYNVEMWRECLRVLKPGGHLLAFSGSRTYHRMAVAIEDAGFQIRDQIMWVYGSGFPKSLNISKAIDKMDAKDEQQARRYRFTAWVRSTGVTAKQIDQATQTMMGSHYTTHPTQPSVMTREHLEACRHLLGDIPRWVEIECDIRSVESKNFASREVMGTKKLPDAKIVRLGFVGDRFNENASVVKDVDITAPATAEAEVWDGWGTALKPAHEPIVLARKPLDGTVANNVLVHGVGGLNIDGCRVATDDKLQTLNGSFSFAGSGGANEKGKTIFYRDAELGRFPANFIHDGSDEVLELFPDTKSGSGNKNTGNRTGLYGNLGAGNGDGIGGDSGSAGRFFYCAKANKKDRNEGLDGFEEKQTLGGGGLTAELKEDGSYETASAGGKYGSVKAKQTNHHPTVKPTDLMRYLCRLITPPNGVILDPFTGSGSTGKAALLEGFNFIGIEQSEEYAAIAKARIEHVAPSE